VAGSTAVAGLVAVAPPTLREPKLRRQPGVGGEDPREVHELAEGDGLRPAEGLRNLPYIEDGAGTLHRAGGHAGRDGERDPEGEMGGGIAQRRDAGQPGNVRDLVRIGDDRAGAAGHDRAGELRHPHQCALDVDVGVDERRRDDLPRDVDRLPRVCVLPNPRDPAIGDSDVGPYELTPEDVDDLAARQDKVGRLVPECDPDAAGPSGFIEAGGSGIGLVRHGCSLFVVRDPG